MIVYGWKDVLLTSAESKRTTCRNCDTKGVIVLSVFSKHIHLFWIPIISIGKRGVSECSNCKNKLKVRKMPDDLKLEYQNLKYKSKIPIWQFSGLGLLTFLIIWLILSIKTERARELDFLTNPKIGDVYEFKTENRHYSTFKIIKIDSDSLYVSQNEFETDKMSAVNEIDKDENYSDFQYGISRNELEKMYDAKEIFDINRK